MRCSSLSLCFPNGYSALLCFTCGFVSAHMQGLLCQLFSCGYLKHNAGVAPLHRPRHRPEQFHQQFVARNKPVVLTDAVEHWPALKLWSATYLMQRVGDIQVLPCMLALRLWPPPEHALVSSHCCAGHSCDDPKRPCRCCHGVQRPQGLCPPAREADDGALLNTVP